MNKLIIFTLIIGLNMCSNKPKIGEEEIYKGLILLPHIQDYFTQDYITNIDSSYKDPEEYQKIKNYFNNIKPIYRDISGENLGNNFIGSYLM